MSTSLQWFTMVHIVTMGDKTTNNIHRRKQYFSFQ